MTTTPITGQVFGEQEARQRTHDFLVSESQKTFAELRPYFAAARGSLMRTLEGVNDIQARFQPPGGEGEDAWGIGQVVQHVTGAATRNAARFRALNLGEELPPTAGGRPVNDDTPMDELLAKLRESETALLAALDAVEGKEQLDKTTAHPTFGELNARGFFRLQALHEEDHARQIEKIKTHTGYPRG